MLRQKKKKLAACMDRGADINFEYSQRLRHTHRYG